MMLNTTVSISATSRARISQYPLKSGAAKGDDGVITIGDGETFNYMHMMGLDTVYITGSGAVAVAAKNEAAANFKAVRRGGETNKKSVLIGGTVYTGTEYNEQSKPISGLKDELSRILRLRL